MDKVARKRPVQEQKKPKKDLDKMVDIQETSNNDHYYESHS